MQPDPSISHYPAFPMLQKYCNRRMPSWLWWAMLDERAFRALGITHFSQIITRGHMLEGRGAGKSATRIYRNSKLGQYKRQPPPKFENITLGSCPPQEPIIPCNTWPFLLDMTSWNLSTKHQFGNHSHVQPQSYGANGNSIAGTGFISCCNKKEPWSNHICQMGHQRWFLVSCSVVWRCLAFLLCSTKDKQRWPNPDHQTNMSSDGVEWIPTAILLCFQMVCNVTQEMLEKWSHSYHTHLKTFAYQKQSNFPA